MSVSRFILEALEESPQAMVYRVSSRLAALYPDCALIEGLDCDFQIFPYIEEGLCTIRVKEGVHPQVNTWWVENEGLRQNPTNVWYEVQWRGHDLEVLLIDSPDLPTHHWILGPSEAVVREFYAAVCRFDPDFSGSILVFQGGRFDSSKALFRGLGESSFEDLILPGDLKSEIQGDIARFFQSRSTYEALGAPWKRGILLTGPPGNGKTHMIKALVGSLRRPCLYIKSLKSERWTEETAIQRIFERARLQAPCLVVLEDLDALVTDENRSYLLNELDGFAKNAGIVVIATTNHPERLDPALIERPSRFDRKYEFPLPAFTERLRFLSRWRDRAPEALRPGQTALELAAESTEGFSFAYLKELFLSTALAAAASPTETLPDDLLLDQVSRLREQLRPNGAS